MLPLHDVALDEVERRLGHRGEKVSPTCAESDSYIIKSFLRVQTTRNGTKYL